MSRARRVLVGLRGAELEADERAALASLRPHGVLLFERNVVDREQLARLVQDLRHVLGDAGVDRVIVAMDAEGGLVFPAHRALDPGPSAATLGAIDRPDLTRAVHAARGRALRAVGVDVLLAPVADVDTFGNPVLGVRAFGREAEVVARHVAAAVAGLAEAGVVACAKHWPGHGAARHDSHRTLPTVERAPDALDAIDGAPFRAAVAAGVPAIMIGHLHVPAWSDAVRPVGVDPGAIARLRHALDFPGVLLSDAVEMDGLADHGPEEMRAAGIDLVLFAAPVTACRDAAASFALESEVELPRPAGVAAAGPVDFPWADAAVGDVDAVGGVRRWWVVDAAGDDRLLRVPDDPARPRAAGRALEPGVWRDVFGRAGARVEVVAPEALDRIDVADGDGIAVLAVRSGRVAPFADALRRRRPRVWWLAGAAALDGIGPVAPVPLVRTPELRPETLSRVFAAVAHGIGPS